MAKKTVRNDYQEMEAREAQHGQRMIEVKIRFWTNDIAEGKGVIRPKHAWARGVVRMERKDTHNIKPQKALPFNSLMELPGVIEKVLIAHEITLHPSPKMRKYLEKE
jgi:hypothetical protein